MNTFKEIFLICLSVVLMFGGLVLIITAEIANGIMLVGAMAIVIGISIFIILARNAMDEDEIL